jgi:hypothetical protein
MDMKACFQRLGNLEYRPALAGTGDAWRKMFIIRIRGCMVRAIIEDRRGVAHEEEDWVCLSQDIDRLANLAKDIDINLNTFWSEVECAATYCYALRSGETVDEYMERLFAHDPVVLQRERAKG